MPLIDDLERMHVHPLGDYREHVLVGLSCWCKPELTEDGFVLHHAMDGREAYEERWRLKH